jgi:hypothetical protein
LGFQGSDFTPYVDLFEKLGSGVIFHASILHQLVVIPKIVPILFQTALDSHQKSLMQVCSAVPGFDFKPYIDIISSFNPESLGQEQVFSALSKIKESQKMIKNLLPGLFKQNLNPFMQKEVMKAASSMIPNFDLTPYTERLKTFQPEVLFQKTVLPALLKIEEMIPVLFQKATQVQDQFYLLNGLQDQIVQGTID